ncbi:hypothetical protein ACLBXO_30760 [Methylobacterium sp. C33D]
MFVETDISKCLPSFGREVVKQRLQSASATSTVWASRESAALFSAESSTGQLGTLDSVLTVGWDRSEDHLAWSVGSECKIHIPVPETWSAPFVLQIFCSGFYHDAPGQQIGITLQSGSVIERLIDRSEQHLYIPVSEEDVSGGLIKITLLVSAPISPAEIASESTDTRRLGLAVHWIKILQDMRQKSAVTRTVWASRRSAALFSAESSAGQLGTLDSVLTVGWDRPEDHLAWSIGSECKIHIPVPETWSAPFVLQIGCSGFYHDVPGQQIRITLQSGSVIERLIDRSEQHLHIPVFEEDVSGGLIVVTVLVSAPISPAEIAPESADTRRLGLAVHWIKILSDARYAAVEEDPGRELSSPLDVPSSEDAPILPHLQIFTGRSLHDLLVSGWHNFEEAGTWNCQSPAELELRLARRERYFVTMSVEVFNPRRKDINIDFITIGGRQKSFRFTGRSRTRSIEIQISPNDIDNRGFCALKIRSNSLLSPSEVGKGGDDRLIGFRITSLQISNLSSLNKSLLLRRMLSSRFRPFAGHRKR